MLIPKRHHTVSDQEMLMAKKITEAEPGKFVFDMEQNMVGVAQIKVPVKKNKNKKHNDIAKVYIPFFL